MSELPQIILKHGRERAVQKFHPWIFSGAVNRIEGSPAEGAVVEVLSAAGDFLGVGHYYNQSLCVRLFSFEKIKDEAAIWRERLAAAITLRASLGLIGNAETNMFRLVNGEGDGFPGLIVDVYADTAVMQCHSPALYRQREFLADELMTQLSCVGVYDKSAEALRRTYPDYFRSVQAENGILRGRAGEGLAVENGFEFQIDWVTGQKTGFFLDQRENRQLLRRYAAGRNVLNCFSYTGGFSVFALAGGAKKVTSVDSSQPALEIAARHVSEHFPNASHEAVCADCRDFLREEGEQYSCVVLDPPPFARSQKVTGQALRAYQDLNYLGFSRMSPNSLMFTFSCSQPVAVDDFAEAVRRGAAQARRTVKVLSELQAAPDHPKNLFHPEGGYLKGLLLAVE